MASPLINLVLCVFLALITYKTYEFIHNVYFHPLSRFPGPIHLAASHLPRSYHQIRGELPQVVRSLHDTYGPIVRVSPTELSFTSTQAFTDVYGRTNPQNPKDESVFSLSDGLSEKPIGFANDADHARQKAHLSHAFSAQALEQQLPVLHGYIDLCISQLKRKAISSEKVDIASYMNWLTFDIIGDLVLGAPFNRRRDERYHPWITVIFDGLVGLAVVIELKRYGLLRFIEPLVPKSMRRGRIEMVEYTARLTKARLELGETDKPDLVTLMSRGNRKGVPATTEGERFGNAEALVVAGSNTVAVLLGAALYLGLTHPEKFERVKMEVRSAFPDDGVETMGPRGINGNPGLRYTLAFLDEALRVHPSVPNGLARVSPVGGVTVDGEFVGEGVTLNIYHFAAFRTRCNWGRPDEFLPERWLDGEGEGGGGNGKEDFRGDSRGAFRPFNTG